MITLEKKDVIYLYLNLKKKYMRLSTCTFAEIYDFSRNLMDNKDENILVIDGNTSTCLFVSGDYISIDEGKMEHVSYWLEYVYLKLFSIISSGYLENIFLQVSKNAILREEENLERKKARWNELRKEFYQDKNCRS